MVYRSSPSNWAAILAPLGGAARIIAQEGFQNKQMIQSAADSFVNVVMHNRDQAAAQQRFSQQMGMQEARLGMERERLDMQKAAYEEDLRDRQAFNTYILDRAGNLGDIISQKASSGIPPDPSEKEELTKLVAAAGSPDAIAIGLMKRQEKDNCRGGT